MVDVVADTQREVELLRLEPGDLAAEDLVRRLVVVARRGEELVVALVAAKDGIRQVEKDDRRFGEQGKPFVLESALGRQLAGRGGLDDLLRQDGALGRQLVDHRLAG